MGHADADVNMEATPYLERLQEVITNSPDKPAVIDLKKTSSGELTTTTLTYQDLDNLANRVATRLIELGLQKEQAVAYQLPSGWQFIALTLGIWRAGGVACPLLPSLREREVGFILESSESPLLVVPQRFRDYAYQPLAESVIKRAKVDITLFVLNLEEPYHHATELSGLAAPYADASKLKMSKPGASSLAQLLYTSGTTGEPKGVLHTFQTLSYALDSHRKALGLTSFDTVWVPSPLAHQTGFLYGMMVSHYNGATGVYQDVWAVDTAKRAISVHGARFVQAAMPFLADLTRSAEPPTGLRIFVATGAAVPRQLASEARSQLECAVLGAWGSTECCLVTVGRPGDPPELQWSADGRVIDGMAVRIVDDEGHEVPTGTEGNFQVKTKAMFPTYLHHHEWYLASLTDDGFFDTGDLAVIDAKGFVHLTGRKKDVINRGGEKIPVTEIEDLLYRHEAILDVAIAAMPDERLGERACAFLVLKKGVLPLRLEDVRLYLESHGVTKIYWPERVEYLETLPRTPSGKVQKYVLRNWITEKLRDEVATSAAREV